jgi:hypothetical protein
MRWTPPALEGADASELSYLIVDEIEGEIVGLAVTEWPQLDHKGRLRFAIPPVLFGAEREALGRFLDEHRRPRAQRPLRVGDAFGARTRSQELSDVDDAEPRLEPILDPADWIEPPVYDVSVDAREAAKVSFYGAVAPILEAN